MRDLSIFASLALAAFLPAQNTFTSPAGLETVEGSSDHNYILFARPGMLWQQIDSSLRGNVIPNIRSIAWRRDQGAANTAYVARTIDLEVVMAHSAVGNVSTNYTGNYVGAPTTVFTPKQVNLPDWTPAGSGAGPEPWSIVAPFDFTWTYNGTDDLLWEVRYSSNTAVPAGTASANYGNDFQATSGSFSTSTSGTSLGTSGCIATGRTSAMSLTGTFYNHGSKFRYTQAVTNAPSSTSVVMNLDLVDSNVSLAGLCHTVHAAPAISYPLGTSSTTGSVSTVTFDNLPYNAALVGVNLYFQGLAFDPGQAGLPLVLSNGRSYTVPADPALPAVARVYQYPLSSGTLTNSGPWTGGIVTRFEY